MIQTIRCDHCNTPVAEVKDGRFLVIKAKHHGEEHVTVIELDKIGRVATSYDDFVKTIIGLK